MRSIRERRVRRFYDGWLEGPGARLLLPRQLPALRSGAPDARSGRPPGVYTRDAPAQGGATEHGTAERKTSGPHKLRGRIGASRVASMRPLAGLPRESRRRAREVLRSPCEDAHAPRVELLGVRLVLAPREHVHFVRHHHVDEAGQLQDCPPLCLQQSTGNSAAPQFDVVLGLLGDRLVDQDVAHLDAPARLQHPRHLPEHGRLVRAEVDHAVADHHVHGSIRRRQ